VESKTEKCGVPKIALLLQEIRKIIKTVATTCQILRLKCTGILRSVIEYGLPLPFT